MQARERELHLRLHASHAQDLASRGLSSQEVQQGGLAHARVTAHHQRPALTTAHRIDKLRELRPLGMPVYELERTAVRPHACTHRLPPLVRLDRQPRHNNPYHAKADTGR